MIQATDLRIGNLLLWNPKLVNSKVTLPAFPVAVSAIASNAIGYVSPGMDHRVEPFEDDLLQLDILYKPLQEFEPISLTPEILKNSGFENSHDAWLCNRHPFIKLSRQKKDGDAGFFFGNGDDKTTISFLHQLQNLHFAITGSELDVNL